MSSKSLYRSAWSVATLAVVFLAAGLGRAQEETPEIKPQAKVPAKRKTGGPRALALLQMSSDGKVTLVPIMIRVDGKFYDASAYKATPVPMALDGGTVYEGERSGSTLGLFTVNGALHSVAEKVQDPWIGTGLWLPTGTEAPKQGRKAEDAPVGLENKDEPPRLKKSGRASGAGSKSEPAAPAESPAGGSATPADAPGNSKPGSSQSSPAATTTPAAAPSAAPTTQSSASAPAATAPKASEKAAAAPSDDRPRNADESRPRLRRGKPVEPAADYDVPGYAKLGSRVKGTPNVAARKTIDLVPAISDAGGPDPHTYKFEWLKGEEDDRRKQLLDFAKLQVRAYVEAQAKNMISATAPKVPAKKAAAKTPEPILENVQMRAFDVWTNNQAVMILSADAHMPQPGEKGASGLARASDSPMEYSILLVARTDIYNNLHKLYSGVTDKFHLDVTPKLELIDAVDADGDGRGELLFHKITDTATGYAIYRPTTDTLWKVFDTLNP